MIASSIEAVLFDAVGTILLPEPSPALVYHRVGQKWGSRLSVEEIQKRFLEAFQRQERIDAQIGHRTSEAREWQRWHTIVTEVFQELTDPEPCFEELYSYFGQPDAWKVALDPDAILKPLQKRELISGVASNYDHRLRQVLSGIKGMGRLDHLIISSEVGWKKPSPAFFQAACRMLNKDPDRVLFIGDDWGNDYLAAKEAGLQALFYHPQSRDNGSHLLRSFDQLVQGEITE